MVVVKHLEQSYWRTKEVQSCHLLLGQVQKLKGTSLHFIYPKMVNTLKVHISTQSAILQISTFWKDTAPLTAL